MSKLQGGGDPAYRSELIKRFQPELHKKLGDLSRGNKQKVGIIRRGKLIVERDIREMAKEAAHTFNITFATKPPLAKLKAVKGVEVSSRDGNAVRVHLHGEVAPLLKELSKYDVVKLDAHQLDLEEIFMRFYNDTPEEQEEAKR